MSSPLYSIASRVLHRASWLPGKVGASVAGRRHAAGRWEQWAGRYRRDGPLLWIHAASVGEALVMEPVVTRVRASLNCVQVVVSHSSPSVEAWPLEFADHSDFIPADMRSDATRFLEAVRPSMLVIARRDLWPTIMGIVAAAVPVLIVGARATAPRQGFARGLSRLYGRVLERVSWVGAVTEADARAWHALGVPASVIEVTGDPAYDRVLERIPDMVAIDGIRSWVSGRFTLVAGSVEPSDYPTVCDAAGRVLGANPGARAIVVPHEPGPDAAAHWAAMRGISTRVWRRGDAILDDPQLVVVAETGLLADIYALGDFAYVGGGFRRRMLHSVVEPAAYGLPVVCGPFFEAQWDAGVLADAGGLQVLSRAAAQAEFIDRWQWYAENPEARLKNGLVARGVLRGGAAQRSADAIGARLGPDPLRLVG
ncbi:MAG: glycosyltransferase N-terminal domain-containing protein [Gemmatimonadales bacterium]